MRPELTESVLRAATPVKPLVMAQIQIGFGPVIGHEHFTMFKRTHRAGIDVQIRIKLAQPHRKTARLQQGPQSGRCQTFAKRGDDAAGNENVTSHVVAIPREIMV